MYSAMFYIIDAVADVKESSYRCMKLLQIHNWKAILGRLVSLDDQVTVGLIPLASEISSSVSSSSS